MNSDSFFIGSIHHKALGVTFSFRSSRKVDPELKKECDKQWEDLLAIARKKDTGLFEAEIYRLESLTQTKESLHLSLSTVPYSFTKTAHLSQRIYRLSERYWPKSLFSAILVKTKEGNYVFGQRGTTVSKNATDMVGGVISYSETQIRSGEDFFDVIEREVREEIGVNSDEIKSDLLRAVFLTSGLKYCVLFEVALNITSAQLMKRFPERTDPEFKNLVLVKPDQLTSFLGMLGGYKTTIIEIINHARTSRA